MKNLKLEDFWDKAENKTYNVNIPVICSKKESLKGFFNNDPKYDQIKNVTPGKIYFITKIECIGDVFDCTFKDDLDEEQILGGYFFEDCPND